MTLSDKVILKEAAPHLSNKSTNWEGFKISLDNRIDLKTSIKTNEELNFEVNKFITDIQQSAWENTQEIKNRLKGWNLPKEIKELVQEKRKARKKWQQTRLPTDKTIVNRLSKQLSREIQSIKSSSIQKFLQTLTTNKDSNYSL